MRTYDRQRLTEIVLYILNKTGGIGYYHVFKILYFAELKHLVKYGCRMIEDKYCALPDGPVPTMLYDCFKNDKYCDKELEKLIHSNITQGLDDAHYMLTANRSANYDYLSKADIECLDESIKENAYLSYTELRSKSHGREWERAYNIKHGQKIMDIMGMVKDEHVGEEMLAYIQDNLEIEAALK